MTDSQGGPAVSLDSAPARFLDEFEELRMDLSNDQLVNEAIEINHAGVGKPATLERYRGHLVHFGDYLASVHGKTFYTARKKHVRLFMSHLERQGGSQPHDARLRCSWCKGRGYPDGRSGPGWSPSYRKSYLSALKFLYKHFLAEEDLPDHNPAALESSPKIVHKRGYTPTREEVRCLLTAQGTPRGRLLAHWMFYAPSRLATFADARWCDLDLDQGTWEVVGKGDKADIFALAPPLLRELRLYRRWQLSEAERQPAMRDALSDPETAYVLLTRNGKRTTPQSIHKMVKWHAVRAGVGVRKASGRWDAPGQQTSRVSPHAMRRAWATVALNDEELPIDVVSEVLKHRDISTTRRHYAPTKSDRARAALIEMRV
ncbi:MAG: tyrosine-type recombinase/integrase [Solirubrobacterales bacterium]